MSTATQFVDTAQNLQVQALELAKKSQETAVQAVQSFVETLGKIVPDNVPSFVPLDSLPTAKELVEGAFEYTGSIVELQRAFALELATTLDGLRPAAK